MNTLNLIAVLVDVKPAANDFKTPSRLIAVLIDIFAGLSAGGAGWRVKH
jgi:hypothetical protein